MTTTASLAVRNLLRGPVQRAEVLWAAPSACYLTAGDAVLALVRRGGVALPNAVLVDGGLPPRGSASVGGGLVRVGAWTACPDTWWDPRPQLGVCRLGGLRPGLLPTQSTNPRFSWASERLVGAGPGLTPESDDVLAGELATLVALGHPAADELWADVEPLLGRTTRLSAALLVHAARGEMALPAARYLEALSGQGDVVRAERRLCEVGHTSGVALARGIRRGWAVAA